MNMPLWEIQAKGYALDWFDDELKEHAAGGVHVEFPAQTPAPLELGNADRARAGPRST